QDLMIILKDKSTWTSAESFNELSEKMGEELKEIPGVSFGFQYPVQMRFNELMTGAKQDIVCKLFGEDLDTLAKYADLIGKIAHSVNGAEGVYVEPIGGISQIIVDYDRNAIAQYGLTIDEVNQVIGTAFAGQKAGLVFEGEKRFDLVVRLNETERKRLDDVRNLLVPVGNQISVPLYLLAIVEEIIGPNQIQREDAKRRIIVGFNVRGRDMESIVVELQNKIESQLKFPPGYFVKYGGAFENLNAAKKRLSIAVPVALALIFLMLYFAFSSVRLGLLIFTAIPLSAIGGIFGLALRGMPFSISAGIGFIALFGFAVLNGIVLVAEFGRISKFNEDVIDVVKIGTLSRLRPVLMTALVASLGFLPMALSNGAGAEVQRPLATVVIGGLLIATFLTLFLLPILYILFQKKSYKMKSNLNLIVLFIVSSFALNSNAQSHLNLSQVIDSTEQNSLLIKNNNLKKELALSIANTSFDPTKTDLVVELGQINSFYSDNRFGIAQSFNFPTVYARNKVYLLSQVNSINAENELNALVLKKNVRMDFYYLLYLDAKEKLLMELDSMFLDIQTKSNLKLKLGSSDIIEKSSSDNQRARIAMQLGQIKNDKVIYGMRMQLMMNTHQLWLAKADSLKYVWTPLDSNLNQSHPFIRQLWEQLKVSENKLSLEKSKALPDISFGYSNMSMRGVGADNMLYGSSTRFHSIQVGISVPIFNAAAQAKKVKSADLERQMAINNLQLNQNELLINWSKSLVQLKQLSKNLQLFEDEMLLNANAIKQAANQKLQEGEIDYLEWSLLMSQYISVNNDYLDSVNEYNQLLIEIQFLTGN
ncbi:MAG: efflux RND transporter permease subunit, partial [Bacteroidia bacterium]|nr:efflux RND transporter permease subunit [Bacteroidia bacterium]